MTLVDGGAVAYTGLYRCALHEDLDNTAGDDQQQRCVGAQKVANGFNRDGKPHAALSLHNLHFHNANHETKKPRKNDNEIPTGSRPSYLYANTYIDNREDHPIEHVGSWEIIRAKLPDSGEESKSGDGLLQFESLFRTLEAFDWNECDFKCCPYNSNKDDDPFQYSEEEENNYFSHTHAYVRTIPRSFSVDETNGDVFLSWEGFYQNCDPASIVNEKKLQWTIGVSRLRTEDPYCTTDQVHVMENNFPRCTEPVAIVHQSSTGRDIVLPYGGFTVIPARDSEHRRSFLMSAITSSEIRGEHKSFVWTVPEGGNLYEDRMYLNDNGTSLDHNFADVWDGGTLRLHKNAQTKRPDHVCRSIFNKGIGCMPISENDDSDHILPRGEEKIVLTEEAVASFCDIADGDRDFGERRKYNTPLVTGFEVVWDEKELYGTGFPKQIIFGCYGGQISNGNFGMIDLNNGEPTTPIQLVKGAFPGAVLFPPQDLELPITQSFDSSDIHDAPSTPIFQQYTETFAQQPCGVYIAAIVLCMCILFVIFHLKKRCGSVRFEETRHGVHNDQHHHKHYMELPTVDSSSRKEEDNKKNCWPHQHGD